MRTEKMKDGRLYVQLDIPSGELAGLYVTWPGYRGEHVHAKMERQVIESPSAVYALYTPRLIEVEVPPTPERLKQGLTRFAR